MENSFSKHVATYAIAAFFIAATIYLLSGLFGSSAWFKNIRAEVTSQPYARTITVSAEGKITTRPDIALVNLAVVAKGNTVKAVTKEGNEKMTNVIDAMKKLGIEDKDITSSQYSLYPNYSYEANRAPKITGYTLNQEIKVKIRDLTKVEDVLDTGITSGANQVGQLSFDVDDMTKVKKEARQKAFDAAKEKAQEMADAAGVNLGRVVTFSEGGGYAPSMYANYAMESKLLSAEDSISPTIQPGSKELNLSVSVTYEIE